jgi:hypothetical protein
MTNPINPSKSSLARLMSTENLKVVYDNKAHTASFNVVSRELRLPVYKDFVDETVDMFVGHEVGHALYTPGTEEAFVGALNAIDPKNHPSAKSFLNVVEDVRIDRLIKNKYPGIRRCYTAASADLVKHDLFGLREPGAEPVDQMPMIDRLNLHFKAGIYGTLPVFLTEREQAFADRMERAETFDEVVQIAKDLYEASFDDIQNSPDQKVAVPQQAKQGEEGEGKQGNPLDTENRKVDDSAEGNDGKLAANPRIDNSHNRSRPRPCSTQEKYEQAKSRKIDSQSDEYAYYEMAKPNLDAIVIDYPTVLADLDANRNDPANRCAECWVGDSLYEKYRQTNLPAVRIMARTFERKQSAVLDARTLISKTGIIDPNSLHSYRFNDDIFTRNQEQPNGKKHGMVIYVDWSSSMGGTMLATVQQIVALADFCDMVRIPYEVYAFSSALDDRQLKKAGIKRKDRYDTPAQIYGAYWHGFSSTPNQWGSEDIDPQGRLYMSPFQLVNLLSSKMSKTERVSMQKHLLVMGASFDGAIINGIRYYYPIPSLYNLGSTPLDEAVVCACEQVPAFMQQHGVQVMNTVLITDGGSGSQVVKDAYINNVLRYNGEDIPLQPCNSYNSFTNSLLGVLKRKTGTNIINFELLMGRGHDHRFWGMATPCFTRHNRMRHDNRVHMKRNVTDEQRIADQMKKHYEDKNYAIRENYGNIDAFVMIPGKTGLVEAQSFDSLVEGATTITKIRSAFVKTSSNAVNTRFMLNQMGEVFASQL